MVNEVAASVAGAAGRIVRRSRLLSTPSADSMTSQQVADWNAAVAKLDENNLGMDTSGVVLGRYNKDSGLNYIAMADLLGLARFDVGSELWPKLGPLASRLNTSFLDSAVSRSARIYASDSPTEALNFGSGAYFEELIYLRSLGYTEYSKVNIREGAWEIHKPR
jgi:hypothetical protein